MLAVGLVLAGLSSAYLAVDSDPCPAVAWTGIPLGIAGTICGLSLMSVGDKVVMTVK